MTRIFRVIVIQHWYEITHRLVLKNNLTPLVITHLILAEIYLVAIYRLIES